MHIRFLIASIVFFPFFLHTHMAFFLSLVGRHLIVNASTAIFSIRFSLDNFEHGSPDYSGLRMIVDTMGTHILAVRYCLQCSHR